jgi:hypothetical protein
MISIGSAVINTFLQTVPSLTERQTRRPILSIIFPDETFCYDRFFAAPNAKRPEMPH